MNGLDLKLLRISKSIKGKDVAKEMKASTSVVSQTENFIIIPKAKIDKYLRALSRIEKRRAKGGSNG